MSKKVEEILFYHSEGSLVDFKKVQYPLGRHPKRHELLKDISAMANHPSNEDKFIILGVKENNGLASEFYDIQELTDEAQYQEFVGSYIEPHIDFEYKPVNYKGHQLAYFRIFDNEDRPYLIKKEVKNLSDNKIEYRRGDGFIRVGTSTRRLKRADLDKIYETKFGKKDRKEDLIITPYFGDPDDEEISANNVKYLDIFIENASNQSINLDVEMKVYKGENFKLISADDLKMQIHDERMRKSAQLIIYDSPAINLNVSVEDHKDYLSFFRNPFGLGNPAFTIPQKYIEKDVFDKQILILENDPICIKAEVIVRSDDFTEGILVEEFEIRNQTDR